MDKAQKFTITRSLSKLENSLTPHEYRGVDEVIELIKNEKLLSDVLRLAEERRKGWENYYEEFHEAHARNVEWGIRIAISTIEESMVVDLSKCKEGDTLITCTGRELKFLRAAKDVEYLDYIIRYPENGVGSRTIDGYTFAHNRMKTDENIVKIITK